MISKIISKFVRNVKKQYLRVLKIVQSYAVISIGIKISLITMDKVRIYVACSVRIITNNDL